MKLLSAIPLGLAAALIHFADARGCRNCTGSFRAVSVTLLDAKPVHLDLTWFTSGCFQLGKGGGYACGEFAGGVEAYVNASLTDSPSGYQNFDYFPTFGWDSSTSKYVQNGTKPVSDADELQWEIVKIGLDSTGQNVTDLQINVKDWDTM